MRRSRSEDSPTRSGRVVGKVSEAKVAVEKSKASTAKAVLIESSSASQTIPRAYAMSALGRKQTLYPRQVLHGVIAAVDQQVRAGHEAGSVRGEEERCGGDFLGLPQSVHQVLRAE